MSAGPGPTDSRSFAAVASFARRALKPHAVTGAIGVLTVVFGIDQCIGPVLSGALADGPNGLKAGLWLSVAILGVGAVVAVFQREPSETAGALLAPNGSA